MVRRKDNPPPFEVMGVGTAGAAGVSGYAGSSGSTEAPGAPPRPETPLEQPPGNWLARAKYPILLRVPRGYAVLGVAVFLGLIVLVYLVGHQRGYGEGLGEGRADQFEAKPPFVPTADGVEPTTEAGESVVGPLKLQNKPWPGPETRRGGGNYLRLAYCEEDYARDLCSFFASREVDTFAKRLDNGRFIVYITSQGFPGPELKAHLPGGQFKSRMKQYGREWKRRNDNRGDDLQGMYYELYKNQ